MAGLVWAPWPVPCRQSFSFCVGVALLAASWNLCRLGLQLRRLQPGASVTDLPLFAGSNWHGRGIIHPSQTDAQCWDNEHLLTVHVWTPVGSAVQAQRRLVIDRYIAAVDQGGVISTGHAALSAPPQTYVSLCPSEDLDHSPTDFGRLLRASIENDVPGRFRSSLEQNAPTGGNPIGKFRCNLSRQRPDSMANRRWLTPST